MRFKARKRLASTQNVPPLIGALNGKASPYAIQMMLLQFGEACMYTATANSGGTKWTVVRSTGSSAQEAATAYDAPGDAADLSKMTARTVCVKAVNSEAHLNADLGLGPEVTSLADRETTLVSCSCQWANCWGQCHASSAMHHPGCITC